VIVGWTSETIKQRRTGGDRTLSYQALGLGTRKRTPCVIEDEKSKTCDVGEAGKKWAMTADLIGRTAQPEPVDQGAKTKVAGGKKKLRVDGKQSFAAGVQQTTGEKRDFPSTGPKNTKRNGKERAWARTLGPRRGG